MEQKHFLPDMEDSLTLIKSPSNSNAQSANSVETLIPFYVPSGEPLDPGPGNFNMRTLIRSNQTNKQFSNVEGVLGPKLMGPSPHLHKELDELMYVLEGTVHVLIGNETYKVKAGGWIFRPRGIVHSFWNASDTQLRFVDCFFNQNFEDYLEEWFFKIIPHMVQNNLTPNSPEITTWMAVIDTKFGVTWFHNQRQAIIDKYKLQG